MKKTWFDLRLYIDGLKQLKLMGILFTVVTSVVAVAIPIMAQLDYLSSRGADHTFHAPLTVDCWGMNPLIILLFCVFAPLMTLYLFSFLNKRECSDFYHAIPATRQCLFFSFFAAVMTWLTAILVISNAAAVIAHAAFPHLYLINYGSVPLTSFNCLAGAWFVAACVAVATSVSGTVVVNLLVALILIFFPRVLLLMAVSSIESSFPLVEGLDFAPILAAQYNVPVGFIFGVYNGNMNAPITMWQSGVYTLVIALLYTAVAALLFVRRRSEAAGHSAPSKRLQGFFRFLVGFVISSIATFGVYTMLSDRYTNWDLVDIGSVFLFYGAALLASLVFEVFCTRKFRGLIRKGTVTLLLLIGANAALLGGMYGLGRTLFLYTPEAEDVESLRILGGLGTNYYSPYYHSESEDYFSSNISKLEITDPKVKEIVADQLQHTVGLLRISQNRYHKEAETAQHLIVAIDSGLITRYRRIYIDKEDAAALSERLYENPEYRKTYTTLPDTIDSIDLSGDKNMWIHFKSNREIQDFYNIFKQEFASLEFQTQYEIASGSYASEKNFAALYMRFSKDGKWYYFTLPVHHKLMPRTVNAIVQHSNDSTNAAGGLKVLAEDAYSLNWLEIQYYKDGSSSEKYHLKVPADAALQAQAADWLRSLHAANATENIDTDKLFLYVRGSVERRENDSYDGDYYYNEKNYAFVAEPSGELPTWLAEYIASQSGGSTTDNTAEKFPATKTTIQ